MPTPLTHSPSSPQGHRIDDLVDKARSEARSAEFARRCEAATEAEKRGETTPTCSRCNIYLLADEVTAGVCRHCGDGGSTTDTVTTPVA